MTAANEPPSQAGPDNAGLEGLSSAWPGLRFTIRDGQIRAADCFGAEIAAAGSPRMISSFLEARQRRLATGGPG
jgi:hypothetical protein